MTSTQHELDFSGAALRDAGCALTLEHNAAWRDRFNVAAADLLSTDGCVTSDAVVRIVGMPNGSPSAVGAAMRSFAVRCGLVKSEYRNSTRPLRHAAVIAVWIPKCQPNS